MIQLTCSRTTKYASCTVTHRNETSRTSRFNSRALTHLGACITHLNICLTHVNIYLTHSCICFTHSDICLTYRCVHYRESRICEWRLTHVWVVDIFDKWGRNICIAKTDSMGSTCTCTITYILFVKIDFGTRRWSQQRMPYAVRRRNVRSLKQSQDCWVLSMGIRFSPVPAPEIKIPPKHRPIPRKEA